LEESDIMIKTDSTKVRIEFSIFGEGFFPSEITRRLEIAPDNEWIIGEQIPNIKQKRKETCWSLDTGDQESLDINVQLSCILKKIMPRKEMLIQIKKDLKVDIKFFIVIKVENKQSPAIYLGNDVLDFINSIRAELDFDLYIMS